MAYLGTPIDTRNQFQSLAGNKVVMEAPDTLSLTATGSADIAISMMEIT